MHWRLLFSAILILSSSLAAREGRDFMVTLSDEQWDAVGNPELLERDVLITYDGSVYYGEVQQVPDMHQVLGEIPIKVHELGSLAVSHDTSRVQAVTRNGQTFIGDLKPDQIAFVEYHYVEKEERDGTYMELEQGRSLEFTLDQVKTVVFAERVEPTYLIGPRIVSVVLQSGDRFAAVLDTYSIRVTDGYRHWSIPTSSFAEMRYDGRVYGWLKAEAVDRELPPVRTEREALEIRLAMNGQRLLLPWDQIAVIYGDKGRFVTTTPYLVPASGDSGMAYVPKGSFIMGHERSPMRSVLPSFRNPMTYRTSHQPEAMVPTQHVPAMLVTMPAFYVDRSEVTNAQYEAFVQATGHRAPSHWPGGVMPEQLAEHPVVNVSYVDAAAYAEWAGKRLPTETEWERAAKGASGYLYPYGPAFMAQLANVGSQATTPVGSYAALIRRARPDPNTLAGKVFDMSGNVAEWTATTYTEEFAHYAMGDGEIYNPYRENPHGDFKVVRGGSYLSSAATATTVHRARMYYQDLNPSTGFRCVRDE